MKTTDWDPRSSTSRLWWILRGMCISQAKKGRHVLKVPRLHCFRKMKVPLLSLIGQLRNTNKQILSLRTTLECTHSLYLKAYTSSLLPPKDIPITMGRSLRSFKALAYTRILSSRRKDFSPVYWPSLPGSSSSSRPCLDVYPDF